MIGFEGGARRRGGGRYLAVWCVLQGVLDGVFKCVLTGVLMGVCFDV